MLKLFSEKSKVNHTVYKALYMAYSDKVYKIAFGVLKNEYDAKDVLQDTFIKATENIDKIEDKNKFESWIKTIAYNTAKLKYNRRKRELPIEDNSYIDFLSTDVDIDIPENLIEEKEFSKYIMEQINSLNNQYSEVINLYYYAELTYEEISKCLGVSIGTVKSRLHRGKQILKKELEMTSDGEVMFNEQQRQAR